MGKYSDSLLGGGGLIQQPQPAAPPPGAFTPNTGAGGGGGKYSSQLLGGPAQRANAPAPGGQPQALPGSNPSFLESAGQGFSDFALLNFADEAEAGLRSGIGGENYDEVLAEARRRQENAGNIPYYLGAAGALLTPGGIASTVTKGAGAAARAAQQIPGVGPRLAQYLGGAAAGAGEGAVAAVGGSEGEGLERLTAAPGGAVTGAAGGAVGTAIGRGLDRFAGRNQVADIGQLDQAAAERLARQAQDQGITLTPAELTGLSSLGAQQKLLGNSAITGDQINRFYGDRAENQIQPAVNRFLDRISDFQGDEASGELARAAANRAMSTVEQLRADQARPLYQAAFTSRAPVETSGVLRRIQAGQRAHPRGSTNALLSKVRNLLGDVDETGTFTPERNIQALHGAKLEIDGMINPGNPTKAVTSVQKRELTQIKQELVSALGQASPEYDSARLLFSDLAPGVERVREGVAGTIAELPDQQLRTVASRLFDRAKISPRSAREAKQQLQAADPQAWQAIKRSFLEEQWLKASRQTTITGPDTPGTAGGKFRKALMGDMKQAEILRATLEPDEFKQLRNLSDVLQASGRVKPIGSDTAWNQELLKAQRRASRSPLSRVLGAMNPNVLKEAADGWDELRFENKAQQLADAITSPNGLNLIKEVQAVSPNRRFQQAMLGYALGIGGSRSVDVTTPGEGGQNGTDAQSLPAGGLGLPDVQGVAAVAPGGQDPAGGQAGSDPQILESLERSGPGLEGGQAAPATAQQGMTPDEQALNLLSVQRDQAQQTRMILEQQEAMARMLEELRLSQQQPRPKRGPRSGRIVRDEDGNAIGIQVDGDQ